ncbi:hypothetical protein ACVSQB_40870, partial [Bradyrhizobium elkanii]
NPWPASIGIGGRLRSEYTADFVGMRTPPAASAPVSFSRIALNGCRVFQYGCSGAIVPVEREGELEIEGLLGPQRAVVVEHGHMLGRRNEVPPALARDEIGNRLFRPPFQEGSGSGWVSAHAGASAPGSRVASAIKMARFETATALA